MCPPWQEGGKGRVAVILTHPGIPRVGDSAWWRGAYRPRHAMHVEDSRGMRCRRGCGQGPGFWCAGAGMGVKRSCRVRAAERRPRSLYGGGVVGAGGVGARGREVLPLIVFSARASWYSDHRRRHGRRPARWYS